MPAVYVITEPCVGVKDRSCVEVCPVDCIGGDDDDAVCYIDPDACIGCDLCRPACPVGAIFAEDDMTADARPWVDVNALWYRDKAAARARVAELAGLAPL